MAVQVSTRRVSRRREKHKEAVLDAAARKLQGHLHQTSSEHASKHAAVQRACSSICSQTCELKTELMIIIQESARLYAAMLLACEAREARFEAAQKVLGPELHLCELVTP